MSIADLRREYRLTGLRRKDLDPDPISQFQKWLEQATGARASGRVLKFLVKLYKSLLAAAHVETLDVTAMTLATADKAGRPSARIVLLKGVDARGFVFYTNYDSRKGRELSENPRAALAVYWSDLER
jgi:pyridoxamine 5'-phosphate oxidase